MTTARQFLGPFFFDGVRMSDVEESKALNLMRTGIIIWRPEWSSRAAFCITSSRAWLAGRTAC